MSGCPISHFAIHLLTSPRNGLPYRASRVDAWSVKVVIGAADGQPLRVVVSAHSRLFGTVAFPSTHENVLFPKYLQVTMSSSTARCVVRLKADPTYLNIRT